MLLARLNNVEIFCGFLYIVIYIFRYMCIRICFLVLSWENKFNVSSVLDSLGGNWGDSLSC